MKSLNILLLTIAMLALSSCGEDISVDFQKDSDNTGRVILLPSRRMPMTSMTVDDQLLVHQKYVKSIVVNNLPEGPHRIHISSGFSEFAETMDAEIPVIIEKNKTKTKLFGVPPDNPGIYTYWGLFLVALFLGHP